MPNDLFLDYSLVEFRDFKVGSYDENSRLEGLSIINNSDNKFQIAVSVEAGTQDAEKPPFLIIHDVPSLPMEQEDIDELEDFVSVGFPVEEIYNEFGIKPYENDGCYMRVPEVEWGNENTLYSLVSFNPSRCYHYIFLCKHNINIENQYKIENTECSDLNDFMNSTNAILNWEGMDKISENKFILIADEKNTDFKHSVFILELDD